MEVFLGIASFRTKTDPRSFINHVGDKEYVTIDETVLCTRFRLMESTLLVEREEFDENGAVLQTVYIRPTLTDNGCQYRVGLRSYTVVDAHIGMNVSHTSTHLPHTYSSVERRSRCPMMSPLPTVAEVPEHLVEELSSDDDSNPATVLLDSDLETQTVIISSQQEDSHETNVAEDSCNCIERPLSSLLSLTPTETTHASEMPSRNAIPKSFSNDSPQSVGCDVYGNHLSNPVSSGETRSRVLSSAQSSGSDGKNRPLGDSNSYPVISIYDSLLSLWSHQSGWSELKNVDLATFPHQKLNYLPTKYNGNIVFELPTLSIVKGGGAAMLEGMDRRQDRHAWTETSTTNITDLDGQLSFTYVKCLGHLCYENLSCPHWERCGEYNKMYWEGSTSKVLVPGPTTLIPPRCTILCRICKSTLSCLRLCACKMFYITSRVPHMTQACVHFGTHDHPVATGECREAMDIIREKIREQVSRTPHEKASAIFLVVGKELLMKGLVDKSGEGKKLSEEDFSQVIQKWCALSSPYMNNIIKHARVLFGYIDNILKLKKASTYDYIHDSRFLGHWGASDIVYLFKMSTVGAGSGVDLV